MEEPTVILDSPLRPAAPPTATPPTAAVPKTPLLFASEDFSAVPATTQPCPLSPTAGGGVACARVDGDETPPLSPVKPVKEDNRVGVAVGVVKSTTPLRKTKANVRMGLRRGQSSSLISGCGQNGVSSSGEVSLLSLPL